MLRISTNSFLDWFYPPFCTLCEVPLRRGQSLCPACLSSLPSFPSTHCRTCAQTFDGNTGEIDECPNCRTIKPAFDFATAVWPSSEKSLHLVHQLKLLKRPELGHQLASEAAKVFLKNSRLSALDNPLLIPVPLHFKRLRTRKFNQAQVIAEPLAELLHLPWSNALKRTKATPRQATLGRKERLKNLAGSFSLRVPSKLLQGRDLLLIDDVLTTGATAHECARTLRQVSKCGTIAVFSLVRA